MSDIHMVRGNSLTQPVLLSQGDGTPYILAEGEVVRFGVKQLAYEKALLIEKELTAADQEEDGTLVIHLAPQETIGLIPGEYLFDIGIQSGAEYYTPISGSALVLKPNVTAYKEVPE